MTNNNRRLVKVNMAFSVLPYQKKRLQELAEYTQRSQSDLVREALGYLFSQYQKMSK